MENVNKLKELINDYRNSIKENLTADELNDVDVHINKIISEVQPAFELINNLKNNASALKQLKEQFDQHARDEQWLEKRSKTS